MPKFDTTLRTGPAPGQAEPAFFSAQVVEARRFFLDLAPAWDLGLTVVSGGVERSAPDYAIHRGSFRYFAVEYVLSGRGTVSLQGRSHELQPGRVFAYGPGIRHDIAAQSAEPLVKYFVNFTGRPARALLSDCGLAPGSISQVFPATELQAIFEELLHCGLKGTPRSAGVCEKLVECVLLKIKDSRAPLESTEQAAFNTYQHCRQHIQQHFRRLKSLQQVSRECHISNAYLCRLFRRFDHQSPYQYLLRLRLNLAAELLQQPGALVKQVAAATGFGDPFHFSRAFKAVFGLPPEAFRRMR